jgi:phosphoglycolate phosphatase-like HAD superfamily hydrolase
MSHDLVVLDADGVILDYHEGYALAWERAFGHRPEVRNPDGYHPRDYWDVPALTGEALRHLWTVGFDEELWRSMPALPGAREACRQLRDAGHRLVCVTALGPEFEAARTANLRELGLEFEAVHAVGHQGAGNPKQAAVDRLRPAAFVDDYLPYLQGIGDRTWRGLIDARSHASPNRDPSLEAPHSRHSNLQEFAEWWVHRGT